MGMKYRISEGNHTLFVSNSISRKVIALIVFVDDIIIIGDDLEKKKWLKKHLFVEFKIKYLGRLK